MSTAVKDLPRADIPRPLREVWLAFHQAELCRGLDAVFVFYRDGLEVWCAIDEEKSYQKLIELIAPRKAQFRIELYPARLPEIKKTREELTTPPPSLWQNFELRAYFGDPFTEAGRGATAARVEEETGGPEAQLKQRLLLFAAQTIEWANRLKRYGCELPALAWAAADEGAGADIRPQVRAVCVQHAREVERIAQKLGENMARALPRPEKQARRARPPARPRSAGGTPVQKAARLAEACREIGDRVYRFIYPDSHTVGLADLREPDLPAALRALEESASEFASLFR